MAAICWAYLLLSVVLLGLFIFAVLKYVEPVLPLEIPRSVDPRQDPFGTLILSASVLTIVLPGALLMRLIALIALKLFFTQREMIDALTREPRPQFSNKLDRWKLKLVWRR